MVYPIQNISVVDKLAGKYKKRVKPTKMDLKTIKESAMQIAMEERYALSS